MTNTRGEIGSGTVCENKSTNAILFHLTIRHFYVVVVVVVLFLLLLLLLLFLLLLLLG